MKFELSNLRNSTVWSIYRMRDRIQLDPDYQRLSDIWTKEKRQLLVDTILNDFDVPKLYLHKFKNPLKKNQKSYDYAIIDGKQRLEAVWQFIDGNIPLSDGIEILNDSSISASGMKYSELGREYPDLKVQFDGFSLSVVCIETEDIEIIEEMFSRLNEAVPLSAAEKRNAFGGPMPIAIRRLSKEPFFSSRLPFGNNRYRHFDLAAKFLMAEQDEKVSDTKKVYLDEFVFDYADKPRNKRPAILKKTVQTVGRMDSVFTAADPLLRQVGMIILYYHLFRIANVQGWVEEVTRKRLMNFNNLRQENRERAEVDISTADYELLEFDRYTQSPNDGFAIRLRLHILLKRVFERNIIQEKL